MAMTAIHKVGALATAGRLREVTIGPRHVHPNPYATYAILVLRVPEYTPQLLLLKGSKNWHIPGGKSEPRDEGNIFRTFQRECLEETGHLAHIPGGIDLTPG